jgi:hypothetical protein
MVPSPRPPDPRPNHVSKAALVLTITALAAAGHPAIEAASAPRPDIPKTWDQAAITSVTIPLATRAASPVPISADYYYRMPVRPVYRSYPVYAPDREPRGYLDSLRRLNPEIVFDAATLATESDWTKAGELVFDAPIAFEGEPLEIARLAFVRDPAWYRATGVPVSKDGIMPFARYIVRKPGVVEVGSLACAMCHTRVMPDGTVIKGAQGNFPFDRAIAALLRAKRAGSGNEQAVVEEERATQRMLFRAPWLPDDRAARSEQMSLAEILAGYDAIPPGVAARHGTGVWSPVQIPDLIGIRDRKYLDRTGLVRHRGVGDVMRYAALNQDADLLSQYGDFRPIEIVFGKMPDPEQLSRYSDEQLYALALYLYSLKPPSNPNPFDSLARRGQGVFQREGCGRCHTPPLYTSNKLTPARGFVVPEGDARQLDIEPLSVGTDPSLTLLTRRGTGYYKVPSLKGVWYRGPLEHNGSVAALEDWFDPRRTSGDYVPTGFRGAGVTARAVVGHPFGLGLSASDRAALIAFLRTL